MKNLNKIKLPVVEVYYTDNIITSSRVKTRTVYFSRNTSVISNGRAGITTNIYIRTFRGKKPILHMGDIYIVQYMVYSLPVHRD